MPNGKALAAVPKLSDDDHVEMEDILPSGPENQDEDIMQLARLGDIQGIEKLYDSGKFDASYCDAEGITPLHVFAPRRPCMAALLTPFLVGRHQQSICDVPTPIEEGRGCE